MTLRTRRRLRRLGRRLVRFAQVSFVVSGVVLGCSAYIGLLWFLFIILPGR